MFVEGEEARRLRRQIHESGMSYVDCLDIHDLRQRARSSGIFKAHRLGTPSPPSSSPHAHVHTSPPTITTTTAAVPPPPGTDPSPPGERGEGIPEMISEPAAVDLIMSHVADCRYDQVLKKALDDAAAQLSESICCSILTVGEVRRVLRSQFTFAGYHVSVFTYRPDAMRSARDIQRLYVHKREKLLTLARQKEAEERTRAVTPPVHAAPGPISPATVVDGPSRWSGPEPIGDVLRIPRRSPLPPETSPMTTAPPPQPEAAPQDFSFSAPPASSPPAFSPWTTAETAAAEVAARGSGAPLSSPPPQSGPPPVVQHHAHLEHHDPRPQCENEDSGVDPELMVELLMGAKDHAQAAELMAGAVFNNTMSGPVALGIIQEHAPRNIPLRMLTQYESGRICDALVREYRDILAAKLLPMADPEELLRNVPPALSRQLSDLGKQVFSKAVQRTYPETTEGSVEVSAVQVGEDIDIYDNEAGLWRRATILNLSHHNDVPYLQVRYSGDLTGSGPEWLDAFRADIALPGRFSNHGHEVGDMVDVLCTEGYFVTTSRWRPAEVMEVGPSTVLLEFRDNATFALVNWLRVNVQREGYRIRPLGQHTTPAGPLEEARRSLAVRHKRFCDILAAQPAGPMYVHTCKDDGACLFRSVSHQLFGTEAHHAQLRQDCVEFIALHRDEFAPFLEEGVTVDDYCARMSQPYSWGGEIELRVLSRLLGRTIELYDADKPAVSSDGVLAPTRQWEPQPQLERQQTSRRRRSWLLAGVLRRGNDQRGDSEEQPTGRGAEDARRGDRKESYAAGEETQSPPPLRVSYHGRIHYNSVCVGNQDGGGGGHRGRDDDASAQWVS